MRRTLVLVLAVAGAALAAPVPAPAVTWADWVGDWDGKLKWTSCTVDGEPSATLGIDATDGAVAIDLAPAGGALGGMSLAEDNGGWVGQHGDVTVHVTRHTDALDVAVDLDSGCAIRGTLHRASTGIAACDRLAAWARIEARCTKLARPRLEDAARLVHQMAEWAKTQGPARGKLAAQCEARGAKVADELVDAGCAPDPDPLIGVRGAECQALREQASRVTRCGNVPGDERATLAELTANLLAAAQNAKDKSLQYVETQCRQLRTSIQRTARLYACPP